MFMYRCRGGLLVTPVTLCSAYSKIELTCSLSKLIRIYVLLVIIRRKPVISFQQCSRDKLVIRKTRKTRPVITLTNHKRHKNNTVNQSKLEVITDVTDAKRWKMCANAFGFASDWTKKWRGFFKPIL